MTRMEVIDGYGLTLATSTHTSSHVSTEVVDPKAILDRSWDGFFHITNIRLRCLWFGCLAFGFITRVAHFESVFDFFIAVFAIFHLIYIVTV